MHEATFYLTKTEYPEAAHQRIGNVNGQCLLSNRMPPVSSPEPGGFAQVGHASNKKFKKQTNKKKIEKKIQFTATEIQNILQGCCAIIKTIENVDKSEDTDRERD